MQVGFIADRTDVEVTVSQWMAGKPERSFLTGTKVRGKETRDIRTYRCTQCGFLESYA